MTREEAIQWLADIKENITENWSQEVAIEVAISALTQNCVNTQKWIPCSEKLPSESGDYLVTVPLDNGDVYATSMSFRKGEFYIYDSEYGNLYFDDVIAWQTLPKPYCPQNDTDIGTTKPTVIACDKIDELDMLERMYDETTKTLTIPTDNSKMVAYTEIVKLSSPNITRWYYGYRPTEPIVFHEEAWAEPSDLISRAEVHKVLSLLATEGGKDAKLLFSDAHESVDNLPSVSANSDDLIIKNGKGIQDGLYNIKDGEIFKYKAKGGTVRAYKLVECVSAERVGEWIETAEQYYVAINEKGGGVDENTPYFLDEDIACSECFAIFNVFDNETDKFNFCPHCGAKMKGGAD